MVWTIEIARSAEKQIKKLDRAAQASITSFLRDRLKPADYPRRWGKPLHGEKGGLWRYRVGDYAARRTTHSSRCKINAYSGDTLLLYATERAHDGSAR